MAFVEAVEREHQPAPSLMPDGHDPRQRQRIVVTPVVQEARR